MKKGFVKGEALRLLRTNSSMKAFEGNITKFKKHLMERGYPQNFINNALSEVRFDQRTKALLLRNETRKRIVGKKNPTNNKLLRAIWRRVTQMLGMNE